MLLRHREKLWLLLLLVLAAGIRFYNLDYKSLSIDETIGSYYAREPLARIVIMTINDVHPPLFYLVHHFWLQVFGPSEWAIRSLSILFALGSLVLIYLLARQLFSASVAWISALLLTLSPWHIWISQNGRSNSMLIFLVLLSTLFLFRLLQDPQKRWFVWYGITTLLALLTHYFAFMIWAAQTLYVVWQKPDLKRVSSGWWQTQLAVCLGYSVWLPFMISQFVTKTRPMYKVFTVQFVETLFHYLNPYAAVPAAALFFTSMVLMILLFGLGLYRAKGHFLLSSASGRDPVTAFTHYGLMAGFCLAIIVNLVMAFHYDLSRTMPILLKHLSLNLPGIYASSLKPYHLEQLHSLQLSFVAAAVISCLALLCLWALLRFNQISRSPTLDIPVQLSLLRFSLTMLIVPLLLAGLLSLKSPYLLLRNMVVVLPFYTLIVALAISHLKPYARAVAVATVVLLSVLSFSHYENWYRKDDWRSVAETIKTHRGASDVVLLDHLFAKKPLYYYGVESHRPLRRSELSGFLRELKGDLWIVRSYQNDWCAVDSAGKYLTQVEEWSFSGSTNPDDLFPIEGRLVLLHYQHKSGSAGTDQTLLGPSDRQRSSASTSQGPSPALPYLANQGWGKKLFK